MRSTPYMHPHTPQSPGRVGLGHRLLQLAFTLAAALIAAAATNAAASTLKLIPLFYEGSYGEWQNEGRAITPDGAYLVGVEYESNTVYRAYMDGFFYNVTNNTIDSPLSATAPPRILTGVGYRTSGGQKQVVMQGYDQANFVQSEWMTTNGGASFGVIRRNTSFADGKNLPVANSLGSVTGSDKYYTLIGSADTRPTGAGIDNQRHCYTGVGSGTWPASMNQQFFAIDNPDAANMCGVAYTGTAAGRAVGWYRDAPWSGQTETYILNCIVEYPPPGGVGYPASYAKTWFFNGLNGSTNGEAWAVSADGTKIFGRSPTSFDANWHGYKAIVGTTMNSWVRTDRLPDFPDAAGSQYLACPYGCSADGRYAVGMNYRGVERAVLWDTADANPANWTVTDLTDVAAAEGLLDTAPDSRWLRLARAYSVGINAAGVPVVTGYGSYSNSAGIWNRGFVMTVSLCSTVADVGGITAPVYETATTVTVTGCDPAATTIKVYHDGSQIGSAAGGSANVVVTVAPPTLVAGWVLKATQTVNGQESCLVSAPGATVTTEANPPPVVVLTAPTGGASLVAPATIGLAASVTTNFNTINSVDFYNWGTNLIASIAVPPYAYSWPGVPAGTYSLSARVVYNSSMSANSTAALVTVSEAPSGSRLIAVPMAAWQSGQPQSQGRAISPDGRYVVGSSYTSTLGDGYGFFYNVANGTVIQPSASSVPSEQYPPSRLTGIGYRSNQQLVLDGMSGGYQANWSTTDGGATWGAMRTDTSFVNGLNPPNANSLGAVPNSGNFYVIIGNWPQDINNQRMLFTCQGSGTWNSATPCAFVQKGFYIDNPDAGAMNGVAGATGRAVGYYRDAASATRRNYVVDYPPKGPIGWPAGYVGTWAFAGLDSTLIGECFSVSADGNQIFGRSPTPTDPNWHGYKAIVTSDTDSLQSIHPLPDFPNTGGSTRLVTPYGCTADGRYAVGMNYRGAEKAVLWDTGDANPANWKVLDLTERAAAEGILGNFTSLYRAFSVGTNSAGDPVITGAGLYNDGSGLYNRAFVMVVATPRPRITSIPGAGTSSVTVHYANTMAGKTYTLQYSTNLATTNWYSAGSKQASGTSDFQTENSVSTAQRFYRIQTTP